MRPPPRSVHDRCRYCAHDAPAAPLELPRERYRAGQGGDPSPARGRRLAGALDVVDLARRDFDPAVWYPIRQFRDEEGPARAVAAYWLRRTFAGRQAAAFEAALDGEAKEALDLMEERGPYAMILVKPYAALLVKCLPDWAEYAERVLNEPLR